MEITVYADGGINEATRAAGFAAIIEVPGVHWPFITISGSKYLAGSSGDVEILAVLSGLRECIRTEFHRIPNTKIQIVSDCMTVHRALQDKSNALYNAEFSIECRDILSRFCDWRFTHVKSHRLASDVNGIRNNWCDAAAKMARNTLIFSGSEHYHAATQEKIPCAAAFTEIAAATACQHENSNRLESETAYGPPQPF